MRAADDLHRIHEMEKAANERVKEAESKAQEIIQKAESEAEKIILGVEKKSKKAIQELEDEYKEKQGIIEREIGMKTKKTIQILESFASEGKDAAILAVVKMVLMEE